MVRYDAHGLGHPTSFFDLKEAFEFSLENRSWAIKDCERVVCYPNHNGQFMFLCCDPTAEEKALLKGWKE